MTRLQRIVFGRFQASFKGKGAVSSCQGATRKPEKSTSIRVWNPSGFEAETSLQHDDVGCAGVGGRKSSMP